jgi:ribosome assembly protein YihI (activator of Der GTPase)
MEDQSAKEARHAPIMNPLIRLPREAREAETDARLEALLLEGLASGDPIPGDDDYWKDLRDRTEAITEEFAVEAGDT